MNIYLKTTPVLAFVIILLVTACTDPPLAPQPAEEPSFNGHEMAPEMTMHFTGRDSLFGTMMFGVNFTARVSGTWSEDPEDASCRALEGTGSATHMGRVAVDHSICVDGDGNITQSEFSIKGRRTFVDGQHREISTDPNSTPTLVNGLLSGGLQITETDIVPTQIEDTGSDQWPGWGWINGELNEDGSFSYEIDGWLHHKKVHVPGLEDRF